MAPDFLLFSGFRVEIIVLNLQDGTRNYLPVVRIEGFELRNDLPDLLPR